MQLCCIMPKLVCHIALAIGQSHFHVVKLCSWDEVESRDYLRHVTELVRDRQKETWQFDLTWLSDNGYTIPVQLRPLCCDEKVERSLEKRSEIPLMKSKKYIKSRCVIM